MTDPVTATCHCGAVELSVRLSYGLATARRCDCSFCRRRGAMTVSGREADLEVLEGGMPGRHRFGTGRAAHCFCRVCGCCTHHRRASDPRLFGVKFHPGQGETPDALS